MLHTFYINSENYYTELPPSTILVILIFARLSLATLFQG